jgi:hypothetical protein
MMHTQESYHDSDPLPKQESRWRIIALVSDNNEKYRHHGSCVTDSPKPYSYHHIYTDTGK